MSTSPSSDFDPTPTPPTGRLAILSPEPGMALALSGGGYRAMLFHLGSLWRLNEAGLLGDLVCVSSVSGGSITAAALAVRWKELDFQAGSSARLLSAVVEPVRSLARHTIDVGSIVVGLLNPFSNIADSVAAAYRKFLLGTHTLQDLPDHPRFVINASNVQTGALWRFSKGYMGDYRVGRVPQPNLDLAIAVGASSAFPPFLSPVHLRLPDGAVRPDPRADLNRPPFTTNVVLTDGGVYDNLGLEPVFKSYQTVLIGDAGAQLAPEEEPSRDWARHSRRVVDLVDHQVRSLRKRVLVEAYRNGTRRGAYWGIATDISNYELGDALECPCELTQQLAMVPTRLAAVPDALQERLINWGYAVCDAALRKHVRASLPRPAGFPYPRGV
jgi:NTE family protein